MTASTIWRYPVHRQMSVRIALVTSSRVGSGTLSSRALEAMTMPGVQKPHCTAPVSA